MSTVLEMKDEWVKTASLFGDVEAVMIDALRRYAIDKCIQKIEQARAKIKIYESRYRCDYDTFSLKVQTDEDFLRRVEQINLIWEEDAMEWEGLEEERRQWLARLRALQIEW
jgi:hypothetical protein